MPHGTGAGTQLCRADDGPLDSYSETVMRVAETVTPHVAAIEMTGNRRNGRSAWVPARRCCSPRTATC